MFLLLLWGIQHYLCHKLATHIQTQTSHMTAYRYNVAKTKNLFLTHIYIYY